MGTREEEEKSVPLLLEEEEEVSSERGRGRGRINRKASSAQTLGNIIVSIVGTGILGLPYAFRIAGWLAGSLGVILAGISTYYCMLLLVSYYSLSLTQCYSFFFFCFFLYFSSNLSLFYESHAVSLFGPTLLLYVYTY